MTETVLGVLASGRGSNLQAIFETIDAGHLPVTIGVVISDNPSAAALSRASSRQIPAVCIERNQFASKTEYETAMIAALSAHGVNLVVLAGFMRLLGPVFLRHFAGRVMNIHPSLLPAFPGLDAQGQAIRYGVKVAGCTIHFVDEGMDSGPIILQAPVPVQPGDTHDTLAARILEQEHILYPRAIGLFAQGKLQINGRQVMILDTEEVGV